MKRRLFLLVCGLMCAAMQPAWAAEGAPVRVLIVDGLSNHEWKLTTALIRGILEPTGLFKVVVSTAPPTKDSPDWATWRPRFTDYDVVIQTTTISAGVRPGREPSRRTSRPSCATAAAPTSGTAATTRSPSGPCTTRCSASAGARRTSAWLSVANDGTITRIPAGDGPDTGHGARLDTVVHRRGDHPIHAGLPRAWKTPDIEVYYYARGPAERIEVLSYGFDPKTAMNWPLEWTVTYGKGRVYTSTFGHVWAGDTQPARMRCAGLHTVVVRALQWLAGRPVTAPIPADFPTADAVSVRGEIPISLSR
jgi:hypothetical protein